jgi:DNA-binding response OmpR family regulator
MPSASTGQEPSRVLVVEPHPTLRTVLVQRLRQDGHLTAAVANAAEALEGHSGLQERVTVGPLEVHLLLRQVTLREQPVELSPREFALLCALLMPPGLVRSRQELLRMAWPPFSGGPRSVDTQVLTLRRKLEQAGLGEGGGITTVRQRGYRFSLDNLPAS